MCLVAALSPRAEAQATVDAPPDEDSPTTTLHLSVGDAHIHAPIRLQRGPGLDPIEACLPPCAMTLPEGHYRVSIADGAVQTAFHLYGPTHRVRIVRENRAGLREIGQGLGVVANGGLVLAIVTALIGAGVSDLGGSLPDEMLITAAVGVLVAVAFGTPALALGMLEDVWSVRAQ